MSALLDTALKQKDEAAICIAQNAVNELMELIKAVSRQINDKTDGSRQLIPLIIGGGVLLHNRYIRERLEEMLVKENPHIALTAPEQDAAYGAAMLAMYKAKSE